MGKPNAFAYYRIRRLQKFLADFGVSSKIEQGTLIWFQQMDFAGFKIGFYRLRKGEPRIKIEIWFGSKYQNFDLKPTEEDTVLKDIICRFFNPKIPTRYRSIDEG